MRSRPFPTLRASALLLVLALVTACVSAEPNEAISDDATSQAEVDGDVDSPEPTDDGDQANGDFADDTVIRVGAIQEPVNMHPANLALGNDRMMAMMMFSGLVRYVLPTTEIAPDLAREWEVSDDGLTYTFYLHEGVQFHQGYGELTSDDVRFTIEYHQDPDNGSVVRTLFEPVASVDTPDPYTVVINLTEPVNGFLDTLAWQNGYILSEAAVTERADAYSTEPIGSGPFELSEWSQGQGLTFTRFDDYFGDRPQVNEIRIQIIPSELTQVLAVSNGELDVASITTVPALETAQTLEGIVAKTQPSQWVNIAHVNCRPDHATGDVRVRQALMHAFDIEAISDGSRGFQQPQVTFLNPYIFGYSENVPVYEYDPDRARALLDEAGYGGEPISIVYTDTFQFEDLAQAMKSSFDEVGVNTVLEKVDRSVSGARAAEGDFDLWMSAAARNTPDEYLSPYFVPDAPRDFGLCAMEELGDLIPQARAEPDEESALALYEEIQRIVQENVLIMPISLQQGAWGLSPRITEFEFDAYPFLADFQRVRIQD
jgi:ABC-type transport system substrate-binding protein